MPVSFAIPVLHFFFSYSAYDPVILRSVLPHSHVHLFLDPGPELTR